MATGSSRSRDGIAASPQGESTHAQILQTSIELFSERGYAATTMRQLAERAGMPISAFYYYFTSKYQVLLAIVEGSTVDLAAEAAKVLDPDLRPDIQLRELVKAHVAYHLANPLAARIADSELRSLTEEDLAIILRLRRDYEAPYRESLTRGIELGLFESGLDVTVAKNLILTMSTAVIEWWRPKGSLSQAKTAELIADFALRMVSDAHS